MTDYSELVKALRCCAENFGCPIECPRYSPADEGVRACASRLEKDAAAAIEALQYEIRESMQKCAECGENEPKRGKWIWIQKENGGQYKGCSVCHAPIPTDSMLDYLDDEDCDFCYSCGAKMEVQDGSY